MPLTDTQAHYLAGVRQADRRDGGPKWRDASHVPSRTLDAMEKAGVVIVRSRLSYGSWDYPTRGLTEWRDAAAAEPAETAQEVFERSLPLIVSHLKAGAPLERSLGLKGLLELAAKMTRFR